MSRDGRLLASIGLLVCLPLGLVGLSPASGAARAVAPEPGQIAGTVTGPGGALLEGAFVSAYEVNCGSGCASAAASTAVDGTYVVDDLPSGTYVLLFQKGFDHLAEYYDNVTADDAATEVTVTAGSTVTGIDARLEHGGHLTGTVTGRAGRPLKGITATAYIREGGTWQYRGEDSTARDGSYEISGDLLSGVYRLRFTDDSEPGYVTQYYPEASTLQAATNVVMDEDETVTDLDVRLTWPSTMRMVEAPKVTGRPRAGATLVLHPGTWSPAKVDVTVLGWYADDLQGYLGSHTKKLRLIGEALSKARGASVLVRFRVSAPGYITVDRVLTVSGGPVPG